MRVSTVGFPTRDDGATAAEYAIMLALIITAVISVIHTVGDTSSGIWASDVTEIQNAVQGP